MEFFLCVIGMVMIVEGLPYFAFPEKMKFWVQKVLEREQGGSSLYLDLSSGGPHHLYFCKGGRLEK